MAWMIEIPLMVLLLLVQIKLVPAPHHLSCQVNHLIMSLFLIIWRIRDLIFLIVSIVKITPPKLWEAMLEPNPIQSQTSYLNFQSL